MDMKLDQVISTFRMKTDELQKMITKIVKNILRNDS